MADSEILYVVKANNTQAIQEFDKLGASQQKVAKSTEMLQRNTQNSNMLLMSTGRIVQDMPYGFMAIGNNITFMAEQMGYMRSQGMGVKDMLLGMVHALKGPMGVIFAISTVTSLLTVFGDKLFGTKKATEDAAKNVRTLRDEFNSLKKSIYDVNTALNFQQIEAMGKRKVGLQGLISKTEGELALGGQNEVQRFKLLTDLGNYKRELESINKEQEYQMFIFDKWQKMNADNEKNVNKQLKEQLDLRKDIYGEAIKPMAGAEQTTAFGAGMTPLQGPSNQILNTEQIKEGFNQVNEMASGAASVLRNEFSSAWEDIFGEANSLFEKLLASMVSSLADAAATSLMGSFLNFLFPGVGSLFSGAASASSSSVINLQMDKQTMATWYVGGKNQANRLRMD